MIKAESRSNLFFPPLGAATANDNAIKLTHIWINRRSEQMCIDWHLCYWCNETQARSSRSISRGPNCEKEQRLHIHSALSISKVCATVVSYYEAIVSVKYRHTVQIKFFKCYTYWPKWRQNEWFMRHVYRLNTNRIPQPALGRREPKNTK